MQIHDCHISRVSLSPKKLTLIASLIIIAVLYIALHMFYKQQAKAIVQTAVSFDRSELNINNLIGFNQRLHTLAKENKYLAWVQILDHKGDVKAGFGDHIDQIELKRSMSTELQVSTNLKLESQAYFKTEHEVSVFIGFVPERRLETLMCLNLFCFLLAFFVYRLLEKLQFRQYLVALDQKCMNALQYVAHELKEPLNTLLALKGFMSNDMVYCKDEEVARFLKEAVSTQADLSNQIVLAALNLHQQVVCNDFVAPFEIVEAWLAAHSNCQCHFDVPEGLRRKLVPTHRPFLVLIIANILRNAFLYSSKLVWISMTESSGRLVLSFANSGHKALTGPKIPIFGWNPKVQTGPGFGLRICYLSAQKIGAKVVAESHSAATVFHLSLPLLQSE